MKTLLSLIAALCVIVACSSDDNKNAEATGTWVLTEMLSDPGDGSGTFQPVQSTKMITLHTDGTYTASETFCSFTPESGTGTTSGTYTDTQMSCQNDASGNFKLTYEFEGNALIVSYPCFEPCMAKFEQQEL